MAEYSTLHCAGVVPAGNHGGVTLEEVPVEQLWLREFFGFYKAGFSHVKYSLEV